MGRSKTAFGSQIEVKSKYRSPQEEPKRTAPSIQKNDAQSLYSSFDQINGKHPLQTHVPESAVLYRARKKKGGTVLYFNFELASEMGLLHEGHAHELNPMLKKKVLETFGLQIINEYDILHKLKVPKKEMCENFYMATRYLQLQHPSKTGKTSGDGRSMWNGTFYGKGKLWDVSSCGTGATCLSPATAIEKKYFKTGDPTVSYGCGLASAQDGLSGIVMSEIFHQSGVPTERSLAVIEYEKGISINVRVSECLLRPSHFFLHLKQGNKECLKRLLDLYLKRQIQNGKYSKNYDGKNPYDYFLEQIVHHFSSMTAIFESEYIFCWMDWDGDNILMDGGIIDYGSVRQFGLYHSEYRYDDDERWSTTIPEQKKKSKAIVQTFIQMIHFLKKGEKKPLSSFKKDPLLKKFDVQFEHTKNMLFLKKIGLQKEQLHWFLKNHLKFVESFRSDFEYFEKQQSKKGVYKVSDGVTSDAIFCMRDLLRLFPRKLMHQFEPLKPEEFISLMKSSYARKKDIKLNPTRKKRIQSFQKKYFEMLSLLKNRFFSNADVPFEKILNRIIYQALIINRSDRMTGDGVLLAANSIYRNRKKMEESEFIQKIDEFIRHHSIGKTQKPFQELDPFVQKWTTLIIKNKDGI